MSQGIVSRKVEMEYTQKQLAAGQCVTRKASPEEIEKILSERGKSMGKRGPKPGFKRDKRTNINELADQAIIQASKNKALAAAARSGIESVIDAAPVTKKANPVTENTQKVTPPMDNWDELAAQTKGAVLKERELASKPTIDEVKIWPVCKECDNAVDPDNFDHSSNTCITCKDARVEALQFMDRFKLGPKGVKPAADEGEFIDHPMYGPKYGCVAMPAAEPTVEWVNHPKHYNTGNIEVIDAIEDWDLNFNLGSAVKYIARAKHKGNMLQDLEKASWYINREIMKLGGRK